MNHEVFERAHWIWSKKEDLSENKLFRKKIELPDDFGGILNVIITASYYYEIYINGDFVRSGPVYGDPLWCQYDEFQHKVSAKTKIVEIVVIVHHFNSDILSILPAPGGLIAEFKICNEVYGTDNSWQYQDLYMWEKNTTKRGWALGPCESYDSNLEPAGWQSKTFDFNARNWSYAEIVVNAHSIWANYVLRLTPMLKRVNRIPENFKVFKARRSLNTNKLSLLSDIHDTETLEQVVEFQEFDIKLVNSYLPQSNCFTFDFGKELVGHFTFEIDASANTYVEVSGAERVRDGRPWVSPREEQYTVRYVTKSGYQRYTSFLWTGYRYLHFVIRGCPEKFKIINVACLSKEAEIESSCNVDSSDNDIRQIFDICIHTLRVSAQEHLIDCPTREQLQYWGDGVFIAQSLWHAFSERSYLRWYIECFIHCPFRDDGLISSVYPGDHDGWALLDYNLIPVIAQQFYLKNTGKYYNPHQFFAKAMKLDEWFKSHSDFEGFISFDENEFLDKKVRIFIDHPGIGWHDFPHPGIDRNGISCPLNMFYYNFKKVLANIAVEIYENLSENLLQEAEKLKISIAKKFYDGIVFHDSYYDDSLSAGTSWQTNSLAVCFDFLHSKDAINTIKYLINGYHQLCRCSPYFYFYFLAAIEKANMHREGIELIKREWMPMIRNGATTTWETFSGNERDSLCHAWSTAPVLFLLNKSAF